MKKIKIHLIAIAGLDPDNYLAARYAAKDKLVQKGFNPRIGTDAHAHYLEIEIDELYGPSLWDIAGYMYALDQSLDTHAYEDHNSIDVRFNK